MIWKQLRIPFLAFTFGGLMLVLGKSISDPILGAPPSFSFPPIVPLPEWQSLASSPLSTETSGRRYRYVQNGSPLDIEMRYLANTDGDVKTLIQNYTSISLSSLHSQRLHQQQGVGSYLLFVHQQKSYLSACINPRGGSTVTREQFGQNRDTYDLQPSLLLPWLLGQADLRDWRCLWAHLSIPLDNPPRDSYRDLEAAWVSWYRWWDPRFPKY